MMEVVGPVKCERCGEEMAVMPEPYLTKSGDQVVDALCPNCFHVTKVKVLVAETDSHEEG